MARAKARVRASAFDVGIARSKSNIEIYLGTILATRIDLCNFL